MKATPETRRAIIHAWLDGSATQRELAERHNLSHSYVNRIIVDSVPAQIRQAVATARRPGSPVMATLGMLTDDDVDRLNREHSSLAGIAAALGVCGLSIEDEYATWGRRRFRPCAPVARSPQDNDPGLWRAIGAVRMVVETVNEPLTPSVYRRHADATGVSLSTISKVVRRLGWEWGDIVVAAGGTRPPRGNQGRPRIVTAQTVTVAVNDYLRSEWGRPTVEGYVRWRANHGAPDYSTVRAVLGVRSWREVLDRCRTEPTVAGKVHD